MSSQRVRGAALVVLLALLLPGALASHDPNKPLEVHKPDLFATSARYEGTDELSPSRLCTDVYNFAPQNQGVAGFFYADLRVDRYIEGSLYPYKEDHQRSTKPLAGGEFIGFCFTLDLPAGAYRAFAAVDSANEVEEANEQNNANLRGMGFTVDERPKPDLAIPYNGFTVGPNAAKEGQAQIFRVRVMNTGALPSAPTLVHFRDETGLLGTRTLGALQPRELTDVILETDPSQRASGAFTAVVILDPEDRVLEADESNNKQTRSYSIAPHPLPDLVVLDLQVNGTLIERRALRLEAIVANVGNKSAGTTTFRFEIDGVSVANQTLERLSAGAKQTLILPFYVTDGNHTLRVTADPDRSLVELDESNNANETIITVEAVPADHRFPNLVIHRLSALPDDPGPGEVVTLNAYIRNIGERPSAAVALRFLVDGERIGEVRVPIIQPDLYHSARFEWTNSSVGPHTLRVFVDAQNEIQEIHEDDNNDTVFITILAPRVEQAPPIPRPTPPTTNPPVSPTEPKPSVPNPDADDPNLPTDSVGDPFVEITQVSVGTRAVPGGLKGTVGVALRNPSLDALGRLTLTFRVDGTFLKEVLVERIPAAGLQGVSSGELDIPSGAHEISVDVRVLAQPGVSHASSTKAYDVQAGERGIPGASLVLTLAALATLALARRKKADD